MSEGLERSDRAESNGSAGEAEIRTSWDHSLILAIPSSRWGAVPYIVHPVLYPSGIIPEIVSRPADQATAKPNGTHPFHLALQWRQEIESGTIASRAEIATREGISRARVTQIMNLLRLPREVRDQLESPPAPLEIHAFSERRLRTLLRQPCSGIQVEQWRQWVQGLLKAWTK